MTSDLSSKTNLTLQSIDPNSSKEVSESCLLTGSNSDGIDNEEDFEYLQNYYFRTGQDHANEYTNITTFHGMIRVFNSRNWPSLIFWCLVVTTCLVFYMIVCGSMIKAYSQIPTFLRASESAHYNAQELITLCSTNKLNCSDISSSSKYICNESTENTNRCINLNFKRIIDINLETNGIYLKLGTEEYTYHMISKYNTHHIYHLKRIQRERLDLKRAHCYSNWNEVDHKILNKSNSYSMKKCEELKLKNNLSGLVCYPACTEIYYKVNYSKSWSRYNYTRISFTIDNLMTSIIEIRKTTILDILCYLGGASSLFMGCSCITIMELFVFLFKLISNSVWAPIPETEDDSIEDKFAFEFSEYKNHRRFAIFDRETMEQYHLHKSSFENKSILLEKRLSVLSKLSVKKAPKLKQIRENWNFKNVDVYDTGAKSLSLSVREESQTKQDEQSISEDLKEENMDVVGQPMNPAEFRIIRPALRRASTAASFVSKASFSSTSSTIRAYITHNPVRQNKYVFNRNMPMNDF